MTKSVEAIRANSIAIVGMSGRFPGAQTVAEFWKNQISGVESISRFRAEELDDSLANTVTSLPNYVRARSVLPNIDLFDAKFFGILPKEAVLIDPQQRLFLECCWEAFEDAGYDPASYPGSAGVIAGSSYSSYFLSTLCSQRAFVQDYVGNYQIGNYQAMMGNHNDFLSTRVAYKLNMKGPSLTVQTGCSTSLLAVSLACQSLLAHQSDLMLAGGVSIPIPQERGYLYQEGGMGSSDGHCRPFDADAQGTVFGSGVAVVVLKRLEDALISGDQIYAVIRGFAINNDGAAKIGYTAPSVEGQANVVAAAQRAAGVDPSTVGYIEAHGTATPLGDPIELAALAKAFGSGAERASCVVGTVKANVGHLDIASGVTGLIHASHVVRVGRLPPTLHFKRPTPKFDFENSPFRVNTALAEWRSSEPRRAGVSSFGVGGTNVHVVLEEAPPTVSQPSTRPAHALVLSAKTPEALDAATKRLAEHLKLNPTYSLADVAYTLQVGRRRFDRRRAVVARRGSEAIANLEAAIGRHPELSKKKLRSPGVSFMFPGQGSQHVDMGRALYKAESVFRKEIDRCATFLNTEMGIDLLSLFFRGETPTDSALETSQTALAQPAIFCIEYALARLWMSYGVQPRSMIGHSVGEYVAACIAGVFSCEDALRLVAARGQLMQKLPAGDMLSVRMSALELTPLLKDGLGIAAVNAPSLCVVSGTHSAVAALETELTGRGVMHRKLRTSHAFHSSMMDPILDAFKDEVMKVKLAPPQLPYVSCVTGDWIGVKEATDPGYWARHIRETVLFSEGISKLIEEDDLALLEVGPGGALATLARQHTASPTKRVVLTSLTDGNEEHDECFVTQQTLGSLWVAGVQPDWDAMHAETKRLRVSLPTYPFERERFWFEENSYIHQLEEQGSSVVDSQPIAVELPAETSAHISQENSSMSSPSTTTSTTAKPRKDYLCATVANIFEDLSGLPIGAEDRGTSFLELGFDSLFMTQISQALQSKFGVKITFRQLLVDQSNLDALSDYLDAQLAPGAFEDPAMSAPPEQIVQADASASHVPSMQAQSVSFVATVSATDSSAAERLMREQLQAMNQLFSQQLLTLSGTVSPLQNQAAIAATLPAPRAVTVAKTTSAAIESATSKDGAGAELKGYTPFKPLQKNVSGELTRVQIEHIRKLTEQYTTRTAESKRKTQDYRKVLADPRVVAGFRVQWKEMIYPIITSRSKGSHLWDLDGNEYVDILNGFGPIMLGHRPDYVEAAIEKQLHEGFETGPQTLLAGEVASALCEMTGNERATFCNTGSEAVMAAMRVARTVTGKNKVVYFAGDYHGMFDEVLVKGFNRAGVPHSTPIAPGIPRESVTNMIVLEYGAQDSLEYIRAHTHEIAAILVEPVQSRHPNLQPIAFLKELRRITEEGDVCLVFDEVVTGFRVHPGGCQAMFDIRADLATYGKVLAGGMPMGVLAGKARYMDALDGGMWQYGDESFPEIGVTFFAGTFVRHPLAMAACAAVLKYLKEQGPSLQQGLTERTAGLIARLNAVLAVNKVPTKIETFSSFFYFSFPVDFRFASLFYYHLRCKGIHLLEGFPCFLTTEHSDEDLNRIVRAFEETIAEMQAGELLPKPSESGSVTTSVEEPELVSAASAPITESQMEVLLSAQLSTEANCSFNESFTLWLNGPLDQRALTESIKDLLVRHESLRATFDIEEGTQHFSTSPIIEPAVTDLTEFDSASRDAQLSAFLANDARLPFDLKNGPLVRIQVFRIEPEQHAMIFTAHHAVCDGWSINVLLDELSSIYSARLTGSTLALTPLMPFSAYARSQRTHFDGAEGAEMESYWLKRFEVLPPLLDLPLDHPRPPMKSYAGATFSRHISLELLKDIKRSGARQKCTLFATLLAGFSALLGRITGQDDIVIGVPTAGQSLVEDKTLVGHCVNFVPMRTMPVGGLALSQFLEQIRKTVFDAYDHQNYTFGRLVRKLSIPRDAGRLPLLEVQFNLEKVGGALSLSGLNAHVVPNPKSFVNFDLFLNVVEGADGLMLYMDYNTTLIDEETIALWLDCYEELLKGFAMDAEQPLHRLPLLTKREAERVLTVFNSTNASYPADLCVHQLFEQQVAETPGAAALQFEDQVLSYARLNEQVNRLAHYLVSSGVKHGEVVGVYMERSVEMVVALLAIWKAGAAYIPLDPTFPLERIRMVFEDFVDPLVLTQSWIASHLPSENTRVVAVDMIWPMLERDQAVTNLGLRYDPSAVAYVIYTSGSTGRPKGVEVTQSNVVNLLMSMTKKPGMTSKDVLVAVTTISFDIAALEIYLPLVCGAKVVVASRAVASDGGELLKLLRSERATVMQATPVTFRLLLAAGWAGEPRFTAWCGGEALPRDLAEEILKHGIVLWNMYGPTETTIWSAANTVASQSGPVLVGGPIDNTQFYVLDLYQQPVPTGVAGELYIGGDGVARGYGKRPDLTAARFLPDVYSKKPGARLYRTGDLVRRRSNGEFEFLGRADGQIKLRGFRIELGEIETALAGHDALAQSVVMLREDVPGDKRLLAYIIPRNGSVPAAEELRTYLMSKLPDYMVPSGFVTLSEFPLTANGKIDRRALPAPDRSLISPDARYAAPRTPDEQTFAAIWAEVLHLEKVGVEDNVFQLGADSLHVFQIAARANRAGIAATPRQILQFRTVAAVLANLATTPPVPAITPLAPVSRAKYRITQPKPQLSGTTVEDRGVR